MFYAFSAFHSKPAALNKRLRWFVLKNAVHLCNSFLNMRFFSKFSVNIRGNKNRIEPQRPKL